MTKIKSIDINRKKKKMFVKASKDSTETSVRKSLSMKGHRDLGGLHSRISDTFIFYIDGAEQICAPETTPAPPRPKQTSKPAAPRANKPVTTRRKRDTPKNQEKTLD